MRSLRGEVRGSSRPPHLGLVTSPAGDLGWLAPPRRVPSSSGITSIAEPSSHGPDPKIEDLRIETQGARDRKAAVIKGWRCGNAAGDDLGTLGPRGVGPAVASEVSVVSL